MLVSALNRVAGGTSAAENANLFAGAASRFDRPINEYLGTKP
jgi:hypothetical protein